MLHDDADTDEEPWMRSRQDATVEVVDVCMIGGRHHANSDVATAARVDLGADAPRSADVA